MIRQASSQADFAAFASLIGEYIAWCRAECGGDAELVRTVFNSQMAADEIADPELAYGGGRVFLASLGAETFGCGAYRRLNGDICEMKRLFVRESHRGSGAGRLMCRTIIAAATADGYRSICLDTMDWMTGALAMYRSFGFRERPPYREYPPAIAGRLRFIELPLA